MIMAWIWAGMAVSAVLCGGLYGRLDGLSGAVLEGAEAGIRLCLTMAGPICLWSGIMEVMQRSGIGRGLSCVLRPILRWILPNAAEDSETLSYLSGNMAANLLGLGNAATPLGLRAAERMAGGTSGTATDELCRLVVLNTASIQILPTTVAALRASCGCQTPFDILPCVWVSSLLSVSVGLTAAYFLGKLWR